MTPTLDTLLARRARKSPSLAVPEPWRQGWFRCAPGQRGTLIWIAVIHVAAVVGLVLFPFPGWGILSVAFGVMWLGGLGTTIAYHRALAHRSVRLHPAVESVLVGLAVLNGSGAPATWTANHRLHHAKSDTPGDISSPRIGGFWWSHLRWLWQAEQSSVARWAPDLDRKRYSFWTRWQPVVLLLSLAAGLPFGWAAFFWIGAIRLTYALHGQCFVNSAAHMAKGAPYGEPTAKNLPWLAILHGLQGESWHGNHHAKPSSARLGWNWRQPDLGWWAIVLLRRLGLARSVRGIDGRGARKLTT